MFMPKYAVLGRTDFEQKSSFFFPTLYKILQVEKSEERYQNTTANGEGILSRFACSFPEAVETYCEWERTRKGAKIP